MDRRLKERGANVIVNCCHPGVIKTNLTRSFNFISWGIWLYYTFSPFVISLKDGAATSIYLATDETITKEKVSGEYFVFEC